MHHSIALVTGTISGLGYAAAMLLAAEGWREIIVTGRSLARVTETAAQLAAKTKNVSADAKLIIAWWVAALARRLPSGMAVYAVSTGAATDTKVVRNAGPAVKYLKDPLVTLIPGMNQIPEIAARRYFTTNEG